MQGSEHFLWTQQALTEPQLDGTTQLVPPTVILKAPSFANLEKEVEELQAVWGSPWSSRAVGASPRRCSASAVNIQTQQNSWVALSALPTSRR